MAATLDKKIQVNDVETAEEVQIILDRQKEAKSGKVMSLDDSIKDFVIKRNAWKSIV